MEMLFQSKFAELKEVPGDFTTNIKLWIPQTNSFALSRPVNLKTFCNGKPRYYVRIFEINHLTGADAIESLNEFQRSVAESQHYVFVRDLRTRERLLKDAREFGGRVEMETYYALNDKLEEISQKHGMAFKDVCTKFGEVSGDVEALERHLNGEEVVVWTEFEDMALAHTDDPDVYEHLLETKGAEEIKKRKSYLEIR
eukprot:TRINITY_DN8166_c0_g4_i1.p1 TRINITY_DN8166_c0_g4~~TRINITY_DN8166_c0_g4_i1.p1  ORF type:complete len:198 (-),score=75.70 TRINITY_DN8166_c0_g4_i1:106-699(-)